MVCPECGCNDVTLRPASTLWGLPGRAGRCNYCGASFCVADHDVPETAYSVRFEPLRCPRCGSTKTHITSTRRHSRQPTVRYHKCDDPECALPFKSVEAA